MSNKIRNTLFDLLIDDIINQSPEDLKKSYGVDNLKDTNDYQQTNSIIDKALSQHKKNKLLNARKQINAIDDRPRVKKVVISNPFEKFVEYLHKGLVPKEFTLARRDGKKMSDEDLRAIIEDIEELNSIKNND